MIYKKKNKKFYRHDIVEQLLSWR